jgi:hypothetical protein
MNSSQANDQSGESNAGAGMNDNSSALHRGVRKKAGHPGDASNAAGMRREANADENSSGEQSGTDPQEGARQHPTDR